MPVQGVKINRAMFVTVALALATAAPANAQQDARIVGRAVAAESGRPLQGAVARVEGTSLSAISDVNGRFLFAVVPAGEHTVSLSYIGREQQAERIAMNPGESASVDFALAIEPLVLDAISVIGARAMTQAEALNRQKNAANIINVVASDLMGRFPDASAPDAIQRIPGVSIARDQGEGRYIQIRGGSPANTQVTLNGVQVPSPEGEDRQIALDAVPVDLLDAIEVSKAILPNMDADAIGGSVNLVTRRAPAGRLVSMEAAGGFSTIREEPLGSAALTYGGRADDDRFGFIFTGSFSRRDFGSDDLEPVYDFGDAGLADDQLEELEVRHYSLLRRRIGGTGNLDYRLGENSNLMLTGFFSQLQDHEQRRNFVHVVADDELEFLHKNRLEELETYSVALDGAHLLGGGIQIDHRLAFTRSLEHTPFDNEVAFLQEDVSFDPDISDPGGIRSNPAPGAISGTYEFDEIGRSDTRDTDWSGSLDLSLPYRVGLATSGALRFGVRARQKNKLQDATEEAAELIDGAGPMVLGEQVGSAWGERIRYPSAYEQPPFATTAGDVRDFPTRFASELERELDIEGETNDYDLDERVIGAYVMTEIDLAPSLLLVPGVRYEHTRFDSDGFEFDSNTEILSPRRESRGYGNVFPMIHLRYSPGTNTNVRAAFTSTIARPSFFQLVPYRIRDDEDVEVGNPELRPTTARTFDLLLEHYNRRIGVISAGAFHKRLSDPIFAFIEENELGGETEQPHNGDSGTITGVEIALQQQLSGLPNPFNGLGLYANYTFTDSESTLPTGREVTLQGQSRHVFNTALSFERGPIWAQASVNFHDDYVSEYGEEAIEDVFADQHLQLDAALQARITDRSTIFLELVNLTNEPYVAYQGHRSRPIQMEYYERWGRLGYRLAL